MRRAAWSRAAVGLAAAACVVAGACGTARRQPGATTIPRPDAALPFMKAITDVAYTPQVFCSAGSDQDLADIAATGANWVVLGPVWSQVDLSSTAIQPWIKTTTDACLLHAIRRAHGLGLSVAVKPYDDPQNDQWRALIQPTDWNAWFASYTRFIDHYADVARQGAAQLLVVGCEYSSSDASQTAAWESVIASVRRHYPGPLTYAADWPHYQQVQFWSRLDYLGIDAYFPLADQGDPSAAQASAAWTPWLNRIGAWRSQAGLGGKPVIFTEIGYLSRSGAAVDPASYAGTAAVNLPVQRDLYDATLSRLYPVRWLAGLFWFWWDNASTADAGGGPQNPGYTPRGKPALAVLTQAYHRDWDAPRRAPAPTS